MTWKSYAAWSGAGLLATYLVSTPPTGVPPRTGAPRAPAAARSTPSTVDIAEEASRLRAPAPADARYEEPSRNPFRFGTRNVPRASTRIEPAAPDPALVPPAEPVPQPAPVRLSGIATDVVDGTRRRTAILITPAGAISVREGDAVGAEYRVARIAEDAVELVGADGSSRRLTLRP